MVRKCPKCNIEISETEAISQLLDVLPESIIDSKRVQLNRNMVFICNHCKDLGIETHIPLRYEISIFIYLN